MESRGCPPRGVSRRHVLRALAAGVGPAVAGCSTADDLPGGAETTTAAVSGEVTFEHISLFEDTMAALEPAFEEAYQAVTVSGNATAGGSTSNHDYYVNEFVSESSGFDVGMMDVVWPAEFGTKEWIRPIEQSAAPTDGMLETPVAASTVDGTLYGVPLFTDANGLYYRTDLLAEAGYDEPPATFGDVIEMAKAVQSAVDRDLDGYLWTGAPTEGLTAEFHSWLWGMGGSVRDGDGNLRVNSAAAVRALEHAVDLVYDHEITPSAVLDTDTDGIRQRFQQGNAVFMRNWSYASGIYSEGTPVTDKFGVAPMPTHRDHRDAEASCLGGWSAFVNTYTTNAAAASAFATWLGTDRAQRIVARHGWLPTRRELYDDEAWADSDAEKPALLDIFEPLLGQTSARPATPKYGTYSTIVSEACHAALQQEKAPKQALDDAQERIDSELDEP